MAFSGIKNASFQKKFPEKEKKISILKNMRIQVDKALEH